MRFALDSEGDRLLFLEGLREYASKVTPRQKKILANFFDQEVSSGLLSFSQTVVIHVLLHTKSAMRLDPPYLPVLSARTTLLYLFFVPVLWVSAKYVVRDD